MDNYFVISGNVNCRDFDQAYLKTCLHKEDCSPSDPGGILSAPEDQWNCNLCQTDREYWLPVVAGDVFMFQTRFFDGVNADPENPTLGIGNWLHMDVCDKDGTPVMDETEPNLILRSVVAHSGRYSYQLWEIDFDIITEECFSIRFYTNDNQEVVTQHYSKSPAVCQSTVLIRSTHRGTDNGGNYYGSPAGDFVGDVMTFNNLIRISAMISTDQFGFEKTLVGRNRVSSVITDDVEILSFFPGLVPPYLLKWMTRVILSGEIIVADGKEYTIDSFTKRRDKKTVSMYFLEVPLHQKKSNSAYEC